ncbi:cobalamin biosynthesis Mg chelatase CobN [Paenibacillus sp. DS2363]|jgi:hypothetical protein|uniref:Cobalamin biosynthesis Mg chelatase CobN n=1 Tax=Paenibacillus xylanexedens TaxID=528191 RepID=A0ABS4RRP7_PAEXY|nr:cobalamin biosynthesis Mg chelatase CobN [Paenibacillus xylanexedens]MDQ0656853.1 cobalamin biosynthesis Mg chelatase CobN [Paenibacillus sp. W2I17]MDQ0720927.1 cobalamin biosynthesis Mg chelatase CobN [Paenibacillus sp. W4I10]MDR6716520.1 cobalamin biosynthesis Mg chelatase CobN [Paenibacillus sp. 2003]PJN53006.1 hypothetical protein PAEAM_42080 [Paenibacillus sp. GM1FR]SDC73192.1 hypothetical protein SAMN05428987_2514 [Paenibacillus sp. CF095]
MTYIIIMAVIMVVGMVGMGWFYQIMDKDQS